MKSPIKWMGSKTKLVTKITEKFPTNFNRYFEPFVGSGAVFFNIEFKNSYISDSNTELINFWETLRDNYDELIQKILKFPIDEQSFYEIRSWDRDVSWPFSKTTRAARFLYLNKMCFNGIWRINSQGYYNVPFGRRPKLDINIEQLKQASIFLKNVNIFNEDFEYFLQFIQKGDLIYLDPPYAVNSNSGESNYNKEEFTHNDQIRVYNFCKKIHFKKAKFILSNSYSTEIESLYKEFNIEIIDVRRVVGSLKKTRKMVQEVIVSNT